MALPSRVNPRRCEGCGPGRIGFLWRAREPRCLSQKARVPLALLRQAVGSRARHKNPIRPGRSLGTAGVNATGQCHARISCRLHRLDRCEPLKAAALVLLAGWIDGGGLNPWNGARSRANSRRSAVVSKNRGGSMRRVRSTRSGFARTRRWAASSKTVLAGGSALPALP